MKLLLLLDHAPNYREDFLRCLSQELELTVVAHSCELEGLTPPEIRLGYKYIELSSYRPLNITMTFNGELRKHVREIRPDLVCAALNLRYPVRVFDFLISKILGKKWVWWGQIFGRIDSSLLDSIKLALVRFSCGALVYSADIERKINQLLPGSRVKSFNNSQFSTKDFRFLEFDFVPSKLKILFVGRPQPRKRIDLLVDLAKQREDVDIRLVGPGMDDFLSELQKPNNLQIFPAARGATLREHFSWCDVVFNPGHLGLLAMNAACHHRSIVVSSIHNHAPEVILARQSGQYFINFEDKHSLNQLVTSMICERKQLRDKADDIYALSLDQYTTEKMVEVHVDFCRTVLNDVKT